MQTNKNTLGFEEVRPSVRYIGQAGYVFTSTNGTTLAVDLYLSDCVEHSKDGFKRLCPKLLDPKEEFFDFVVATHEHLDHYDVEAIPDLMANGRTVLVAARDCMKYAQDFPSELKVFLEVGESFQAADFTLLAVPCDHGDDAPEAIGLVIGFDGVKVYIAGDTHFRPDFVVDIARHGPFDLMVVPINGAFGNLNEAQAARLCAEHAPRLVTPCHYWMFAEHHGDPGLFVEELHAIAPEQPCILLCPGETLQL